MAEVHEVHEVRTARRGRVWPSVVMLLVVLLLIGVIVAMIMNVRGSISWPAGGVEFGFRPYLSVTRIESARAPAAPVTVATDATPESAESSSIAPPEIAPQPVN